MFNDVGTMNTVQEYKDTHGEPVAGVLGEPFENYTPPSWDVFFMRMSYEYSAKSKDPSTKFGAVCVRGKRPILFGYNGLPSKVEDWPERLNSELKYKMTVHAESNVIACAAKFGISTDQTTLYIPACPCPTCAGLIMNAGITELILHRPAMEIFAQDPRWDNSVPQKMFEEAGITVRYLDLFIGKIAYISGQKYTL